MDQQLTPGTLIHEMFSSWSCVLESSPLSITALEWWGQPPEHPEAAASVWRGTPAEYRKRNRGCLACDKPHERLPALIELAKAIDAKGARDD